MNEEDDGGYLFNDEDMMMIDKSIRDESVLHPEWVKNADDFVSWIRTIEVHKE